MPHLFVNRPRLHDLVGDDPDLRSNFRWETVNAVTYEVGGLVFIAGSICFFPALSAYADAGAWIFFAGSLLYLLVTAHDMIEVVRHIWRKPADVDLWERFEFWAAFSYLFGTLLFVVGSVFFLSYVGLFTAGAWCFVIGSLLFVLGAVINVLQIVQADDLITLQLMNLTALTFVVGSVLFAVASIPYLWKFGDKADELILDGFLAWQYLVGSFLFFAGGLFNYRRADRVVARAIGATSIVGHVAVPPLRRLSE
ncbi:YrhK family protein [Amorphus sp. 3PC139-8]|uniref:YrhK family protein n=1 Tax=Amorphus sp. 3PC139-8 TaxID=2735676 RepID=UPI00345DDFBD